MNGGGGIVNDNVNGENGLISQQYRHSMSQLPFSALANLPKHQLQLLQQSSIYATLSRQPSKATKQPPPPVPIRTNSLKTNSLTDETVMRQQPQQQAIYKQTHLTNGSSTCSLSRSGTRVTSRGQFNSSTMLSKNKSFSGNAHMEASRARFLNRNNNQQQQQLATNQHQPQEPTSIAANSLLANANCNVTTGQDDDFPPPPSPLSMTDSDEHDLVSINSEATYSDVNHGLMTFRVGI